MEIVNSFSNGIPGQTNTIWFTYTVSGFDAVSTLTSYVSSNASTASDGVASDLGGILNQSGTGCAATAATLIVCNEITPVTTSLTVTASSAWVAGGLLMAGGSDGAAVMESYTYVPTVVSTPEPGGLVLLGSGLLGLGCFFRRKRMM